MGAVRGNNSPRPEAKAVPLASTFRVLYCAPLQSPSSRPFFLAGVVAVIRSARAFENPEQSPAVLAKLCACSGALIAEMPYAAMVPRGGGTAGDPGRSGGSGGGAAGGRVGVEESLGDLLRALARLAMDVAAEPSARIAGGWFAAAAAAARLG